MNTDQIRNQWEAAMATKIFITISVIVYILFFLSAFGPMHSRKKFWKAIYKIRIGMDFASYWFFNICGIASLMVAAYLIIGELLN